MSVFSWKRVFFIAVCVVMSNMETLIWVSAVFDANALGRSFTVTLCGFSCSSPILL